MKETLLKKRCGVPAALLIVLLLFSTALAWYCFATISSNTVVQEPLSTANENEFDTSIYPGETATWSFDIMNSANVAYSLKSGFDL